MQTPGRRAKPLIQASAQLVLGRKEIEHNPRSAGGAIKSVAVEARADVGLHRHRPRGATQPSPSATASATPVPENSKWTVAAPL